MIRAPKGRRVPTNDTRQKDFFTLLEDELAAFPEPHPAEGQLAFDQHMRKLLNRAIAAGPYANREALAEAVSFQAGRKVSKAMIDSWTGASRPHAFPAHMIPAFCAVLGNSILLEGLADASGCALTESAALVQSRLERINLFIRFARAEHRRLAGSMPLFGGRP